MTANERRPRALRGRGFRRAAALAGLLAAAVLGALVAPAAPAARPREPVTVQFDKTPLRQAAEEMGRLTGRNFVIPRDLYEVPITILIAKPVSKTVLYRAFLAALELEGVRAVERPGFVFLERVQGGILTPEAVPAEAAPPPFPGIRQLDDTTWVVTKATRDGWFAPEAPVTPCGRMVPFIREGRMVGIKLLGLRPTSPLPALGIRNGDVAINISGIPLISPDAALRAYDWVKTAPTVTVALERAGVPRGHTYRIE